MQLNSLILLTQDITTKFQSQKYVRLLSSHANTLANHLLVLISFFLPISMATDKLLYIFLFILFLFKPDKYASFNKIKENRVLWAIILYVALYYFGIFVANDKINAYEYAKTATFLLNAVLILIFIEARFIPRILAAFVFGVFVSELLSYFLAFNIIDGPFFGSHPLASFQNPSPFMYHIHYGFILAFTSYILLLGLKETATPFLKFLMFLFLVSISVNLVLNIGRTGYILYIIGIFLYIIFNHKKYVKRYIILGCTTILLIFSLAYQFSPRFHARTDLTIESLSKIYQHDNYQSSIGLRIEKYKQAFDLFLERPLFGYGTKEHLGVVYNDAKEKNLWYAAGIKNHSNLDSEYLDMLIQFGLVGLIIYLNIFFQGLRYQQPDTKLKQIQNVLILFYIFFSFEAVGIIHHTLAQTFLFFITITLVHKLPEETDLPKISSKELLLYSFVGLLFFLRSQFHFGDAIKSYIHQVLSII